MIRSLAIRRVLSLMLVLGFLVLGFTGFQYLASQREPPQARAPETRLLNVEVFQIGTENVRQTLRGFGTVQADREVVLSAEVAGTIDRLHPDFEVGLAVTAPRYPESENPKSGHENPLVDGDELVVIDQERYEVQLKQINSQIEEFQKELKLAESELENAEIVEGLVSREYELIEDDFTQKQKLYKQGVLSLAELNRVELELKQYEKNQTQALRDIDLKTRRKALTAQKIDTLKEQSRLNQMDLDRTVIHPPFDGYLSEVFVEVGQYVKPGEPLARITDIEHIVIPVSLTHDDYEKLKVQIDRGENPRVDLSLHEDEPPKWAGKVVRAAPEANQETRTIKVFIEVDNSRQEVPLLPGTFVFARIEGPSYDSETNPVIPRDAILRNRVFRVEQGVTQEVPIKILERLQSVAVVKGDLRSGDLLVLTNLDLITPGLPVETGAQIHQLKDELDSLEEWKNFWKILPAAKSTADTSSEATPLSVKPEPEQVTN